jgi:hypothetical protein
MMQTESKSQQARTSIQELHVSPSPVIAPAQTVRIDGEMVSVPS